MAGKSLRDGHWPWMAGALALLAAAILSTGLAIGRSGFATTPYRLERLETISAALTEVVGDYVLAAGDSHVLRWRARTFCGLPLVNAGIDGATSADLAELLTALSLPRRPRAVVVTVGTNDAFRKRAATPARAVAQAQSGLREALVGLSARTDSILLYAPPPLDGDRETRFWAEAVGPIGEAAHRSCAAVAGCNLLVPFDSVAALAADGVHLRDYDGAYARIEGESCRALGIALPAKDRHARNGLAP